VDDGTASASEIVSGAIQDWIAGLLSQYDLRQGPGAADLSVAGSRRRGTQADDRTVLCSVGRSIQKPSRSTKHPDLDEEGELVETEPTDNDIYYTNGGRKVYGGGGIVPDVHIDQPVWTPLEINLWRQAKFFNFAVHYTSTHPDIGRDFETTDEIVDDFRKFLDDQKFEYETETQVQLKSIRDQLKADPERAEIYEASLASVEALIGQEKEFEYQESHEFMKREIKRSILSQLYGERGFYEGVVLHDDEYVKRAIEILTQKDEYTRLLSTKDPDKG